MKSFLQVTVIGLVTVVFTNLLRKNSKDLSVLLSLAACCVIAVMVAELVRPILSFLEKIRGFSKLDKALTEPVFKTVGIGILTQISANVCADAGESAISKLIELCGGILALYISLPLLESVLDMLQTIGGSG